jgi:1-phosphofructokinase
MILSVTLNPSIDRTIFIDGLKPYDTNRVIRTECDAGGKGINLSRVVHELGGSTLATGFMGGPNGRRVQDVLDREQIPYDFVAIEGNIRENITIEDGSGKPPTSINERGPQVVADDIDRLMTVLAEHAPKTKWLTIGGSLPPGVDAGEYYRLVVWGHQQGLKVLLDADGAAMVQGIQAGPDLIKPNIDEAKRLLNKEFEPKDGADAANELWKKLSEVNPHATVILSMGADGAIMTDGTTMWRGISPEVEVNSTIGSGDSMLGGFLFGLEDGRGRTESFRLGLACGAATATTNGSEIARLPVINELLTKASVTVS